MKKILPLLAVLVLAFVATPEANAQIQPGNCTLGVASADLNVNNVRARLFNNGGLFWLGGDPIYTVPKNGDANAIFASGIWIGGEVDGELRLTAATYSGHEFFPGPLDENGRPPADCSQYDQIYVVTADEVQNYNTTQETTPNLVNWPHHLGAPVIDGDGNPDNYNLAGGDRPEIIGNQTAWWVMNDVGGAHKYTSPIGLEVQVTAFAFRRADALNNATFYRYNIIYEGNEPLTNAYMTLWSDPDLGYAGDDFIGTDTTRGIGFVYNGDNTDETGAGYGTPPPALGYDFFQGPLVNDNGQDDDGDGEVDESDERLDMTIFGYYNNDETDQGNPTTGEEYFNYMTGHWKSGDRWTIGGTGIGGTEETNFIYPGDPVTQTYWSEEDTDIASGIQKGTPADRRFIMSTGPFVIQPGDQQEIVFGIVWAQGGDRLGSVTAMRNADVLAQNAFDLEFELPDPPAAPDVTASSFDNTVVLSWGYQPTANNYLESYEVVDPFLVGTGVPDTTYNFEGYKIYRYTSQTFSEQSRELIATYDVANGVTTIVQDAFDPETGARIQEVVAQGTDSGIQKEIFIQGLTNYQDYYYGVQAYAYNQYSTPKMFAGPVTQVTARPSDVASREGGTTVAADSAGVDRLAEAATDNVGDGLVGIEVVDPTQVTGDQYRVSFFTTTTPEGETVTAYDIINTATDEVVFDGEEAIAETGEAPPQLSPAAFDTEQLFVIDGLAFKIAGPEPDFTDFQVVANASGPLDPIATAAPCVLGFPCVESGEPSGGLPGARQQVGDATFFFHAGGASNGGYPAFISRATRSGGNFANIGAYDYEMRFTAEGSQSFRGFGDGAIVDVPYELWNVGIGTPNDPSDDYQMIPVIVDNGTQGEYDISGDHPVSGADDDPVTDWTYWYNPADTSPGSVGYDAFYAGTGELGGEVLARTVWVNWNFVDGMQEIPEEGTVLRITTAKPIQPGDAFTLDTEGLGSATGQQEVAEAAVDEIGIVPNPYKGASEYETNALDDVARFINLPQNATINVFTLNGTLVRTLEKRGPSQSLDWDLNNDDGLPIASGMYLIHVDTDFGEKVIKFGVVNGRTGIETF